MSGARSALTGLELPEDFADAAHTALHMRVTERLTQQSPLFDRFLGASSALQYRFVACCDHDDAFRASLARAGDSPAQPERYVQERELYNFFVNGLSALESLYYALFAVGALIDPSRFEYDGRRSGQERRLYPRPVAAAFMTAFPAEPLSQLLDTIQASGEHEEWRKVRNLLAHEAAPGRTVWLYAGGSRASSPPPDRPAIWRRVDLPVDADLTRARRAWLATAIGDILGQADAFTRARL